MTERAVLAITGTSRGIGLGMAQYFVQRGYQVAGCSRGQTELSADNYLHMTVDVTDEKQVRSWIRAIKGQYGRVDVLVCNAAVVPPAALLTSTSTATLDQVLKTNVMGTFLVCREAAKAMMLQRAGRIITVSSMAVGLHEAGTSAYSASKSAIVEMTRVLANELAPTGITCNVIAPSVFKASAVENLGEAVVAHALARLTIKRELTIEEICHVVEFFAAPESGCITGQVLSMGLVT
jgi:3-oxoacyl-[acyl-carrier protein] reductase